MRFRPRTLDPSGSRIIASFRTITFIVLWALLNPHPAFASAKQTSPPVLDEARLAQQYFGADAPWYRANIPFLEIDDPAIQRIYYYRWQVYRSHIREIGAQGTDETEFLDDVPWARQPFTDLNDSSSFHILEGRWLRNPAFVDSLVNHLYTGGGNDRHFSESIASATYGWVQVTGDPAPALRHLDTMQHVYNLWDDHFDARRGLYWIEPLLDATEYTISSIDASGAGFTSHPPTNPNDNGFTQGFAFRPSINAYQFGNAEAIASLAQMAGQPAVAADYRARADALRAATLAQLWNPKLDHFTDIYQRSTPFVQAGTFIRGRELVGFVPWMFDLPPATPAPGQPDYASAWEHAFDPADLAGSHGLRTVEPTYPRYLRQYRYDAATGEPECQWNGPAWPFQISQALTGLANLLQHPRQHAVAVDEFIHLLRQYTQLHFLADGQPDVQEDYNPDTGAPIVGLPRSHHYEHSTYIDLILSGLLGVRPRMDDVLELNPLLPSANSAKSNQRPIHYFALQNLRYHDRDLTLLYDADGHHYGRGTGLSVFASGRRIFGPAPLGPAQISLASVPRAPFTAQPEPIDLAVNVWEHAPSPVQLDLPIATASSSAPGSSPYQAIDGRLWFFPQIVNGWSPDPNATGSTVADAGTTPWFAVDLRHLHSVSRVELAFFSDGKKIQQPTAIRLQTFIDGTWRDVPGQHIAEAAPIANGITHLHFPTLTTRRLRLLMTPAPHSTLRLIELEAFARDPSR